MRTTCQDPTRPRAGAMPEARGETKCEEEQDDMEQANLGIGKAR